jgi:hypothetical protein
LAAFVCESFLRSRIVLNQVGKLAVAMGGRLATTLRKRNIRG